MRLLPRFSRKTCVQFVWQRWGPSVLRSRRWPIFLRCEGSLPRKYPMQASTIFDYCHEKNMEEDIMEHIGIVDFCRSPISKAKDGGLNQLSILEIATRVVRALLDRNPAVPRDLIEVVAAGCAFPEAEAGFNIGRCISVKAGLPAEVAGLTLNQFCGSSQTTVALI